NHYQRQVNKTLSGFSKTALARLMEYHYEGNIRELKNIVEYAVNVANTSMIENENLPSYLFDSLQDRSFFPSYLTKSKDYNETNSMMHYNNILTKYESKSDEIKSDENLSNETWPSIQRRMILEALQQANGQKNRAAKILGWGRSTLWRKIKKYEIDP
ncbi:MAG: helix-turn-helix domain-containing protein, partial [Thermodesulfobacteriota bacterium]